MRNNTILAVVGNRGTGKTDFIKSLVRASQMPKRLIVDTFDSPVWHTMESWDHPLGSREQINVITFDQLKYWKTGTYRLFDSDTDQIMEAVDKDVRNTIVVFEDATKYIGSTVTKEVKRFILDSKQKNLDLIFVFHSLKDLPRDLIRIMDYITICKTGDRYNSSLRNKYPDIVEEAHKEVMASPDKYHKLTLQISS